MVFSLLTKIFGSSNDRAIKKLLPIVEKINALESDFQQLEDVELTAKTLEFQQRYQGENP